MTTTPTLVHRESGMVLVGAATIPKRRALIEGFQAARKARDEQGIEPGITEETFFLRRARISVRGEITRYTGPERFDFEEWWSRYGSGVKWAVLMDDGGWYWLIDITKTMRDCTFRLHPYKPQRFSDLDAAIMAGVLQG